MGGFPGRSRAGYITPSEPCQSCRRHSRARLGLHFFYDLGVFLQERLEEGVVAGELLPAHYLAHGPFREASADFRYAGLERVQPDQRLDRPPVADLGESFDDVLVDALSAVADGLEQLVDALLHPEVAEKAVQAHRGGFELAFHVFVAGRGGGVVQPLNQLQDHRRRALFLDPHEGLG
jgi:hypothetical protein